MSMCQPSRSACRYRLSPSPKSMRDINAPTVMSVDNVVILAHEQIRREQQPVIRRLQQCRDLDTVEFVLRCSQIRRLLRRLADLDAPSPTSAHERRDQCPHCRTGHVGVLSAEGSRGWESRLRSYEASPIRLIPLLSAQKRVGSMDRDRTQVVVGGFGSLGFRVISIGLQLTQKGRDLTWLI